MSDRQKYADLISSLLGEGGEIMIHSFVYDESMNGPVTWDNIGQVELEYFYPRKSVNLREKYEIDDRRFGKIFATCYSIK